MSYIPDEYTPSTDEIDEVLSLYNDWLDQAHDHHGDKELAINLATEKVQNDGEAGRVFSWIANNDATLIYDIDESIKDHDIVDG